MPVKAAEPVKEVLPAQSEPAVSPKRIKELLSLLGADAFASRRCADSDLEQIGEAALPALHEALATKPDPDLEQRLERLVDRIEASLWRGAGVAVRECLKRILQRNPKMKEEDLIRAVYLLAVARAPTDAESTGAIRHLKEAKDLPAVVRDLRATWFRDENSTKT